MNITCTKCKRTVQIEDNYYSPLAEKIITFAHSTAFLSKDKPSHLQCVCGKYL